jgi:hypothetical protein
MFLSIVDVKKNSIQNSFSGWNFKPQTVQELPDRCHFFSRLRGSKSPFPERVNEISPIGTFPQGAMDPESKELQLPEILSQGLLR